MPRSMTAFARAVGVGEQAGLIVEIRSVNNRYLDCSARIPRALAVPDEKIKPFLQSRGISRGKVDVTVSVDVQPTAQQYPTLNEEAVRAYLDVLYRLRDEFHLSDDISVMRVAQNGSLFTQEKPEADAEADWQRLLPVLTEAVDGFILAREQEGERLAQDLCDKLSHLRELVDQIEALSAKDIESYRHRLEERLRAILADNTITADENRILTECALHADRVAVDEELVRLRSHFVLFDQLMQSREPVGRKLDFLIQEMNREINTTGSKCSDADIAHLIVDAKNELEKIREQIQNLE